MYFIRAQKLKIHDHLSNNFDKRWRHQLIISFKHTSSISYPECNIKYFEVDIIII